VARNVAGTGRRSNSRRRNRSRSHSRSRCHSRSRSRKSRYRPVDRHVYYMTSGKYHRYPAAQLGTMTGASMSTSVLVVPVGGDVEDFATAT
jgi:hypothetical protein